MGMCVCVWTHSPLHSLEPLYKQSEHIETVVLIKAGQQPTYKLVRHAAGAVYFTEGPLGATGQSMCQ